MTSTEVGSYFGTADVIVSASKLCAKYNAFRIYG